MGEQLVWRVVRVYSTQLLEDELNSLTSHGYEIHSVLSGLPTLTMESYVIIANRTEHP